MATLRLGAVPLEVGVVASPASGVGIPKGEDRGVETASVKEDDEEEKGDERAEEDKE